MFNLSSFLPQDMAPCGEAILLKTHAPMSGTADPSPAITAKSA
ncbi:hypothetical protein ACO9S2_09665 [Nitrospira sp. NS4]